jgi:transcriptional regulator with XRE-family HTH domain
MNKKLGTPTMAGRPRTKTPDFNAARFGTNLKATRRSKGLSQPELANASNVSTQVISNLERGTAIPSIDTLCKIARGLGVNPRELFGAGLTGGGRPPSQTSKLLDLLATFDEDLARQALVILRSLSQVRRR